MAFDKTWKYNPTLDDASLAVKGFHTLRVGLVACFRVTGIWAAEEVSPAGRCN